MNSGDVDYQQVDDAALARIERDVVAVLDGYSALTGTQTPEWIDDLHYEHYRIVREINRRTGCIGVETDG